MALQLYGHYGSWARITNLVLLTRAPLIKAHVRFISRMTWPQAEDLALSFTQH